ncbi:MAG TPA: carbohydrate kinase [Thermoleophilia bacterium]|nr:carbohydrate kinase [Thermoleophilia bacterium]
MIVVAGEALIDLVLDPDGRLMPFCGGGPFNTARALALLGQPAGFLGCLSDDAFGQRLRRRLAEDGVDPSTAVASHLPTTLAVAELASGDGSARYRFYTEGTSAPSLTAPEALAALPPASDLDWLHVGTLGLVLEPIAETMLAVLRAAAAGEALVMLDPNIREALIDDRADYIARLELVLERTDVVKASAEDIAWLVPGVPPADGAAELLRRGPSAALVTRGAQGALVVTRQDVVTVPAVPVDVIDTIGAGDAFGAGFIAWWREHGLGRGELADPGALGAAAAFACLVAARTCERPGATPPRMPVSR